MTYSDTMSQMNLPHMTHLMTRLVGMDMPFGIIVTKLIQSYGDT
jgi:hypothetical protein